MKKYFKDFGYYLIRWLLLGGIGNLLQPVYENLDHFWLMKSYQVAYGLFFGFICAVIFTLIQNKLNFERKRAKTWGIAIAVWMSAKFIIAYLMGMI